MPNIGASRDQPKLQDFTYCESVFRIQAIEHYKNINYGVFTYGGQEHEPRS